MTSPAQNRLARWIPKALGVCRQGAHHRLRRDGSLEDINMHVDGRNEVGSPLPFQGLGFGPSAKTAGRL
jgi:hypothetical protein